MLKKLLLVMGCVAMMACSQLPTQSTVTSTKFHDKPQCFTGVYPVDECELTL